MLAKNIALRNPDVSIYELNYAVQKIIDRIIFLRICEDRGIEPDGRLRLAAESTGVYKHLLNQFGSQSFFDGLMPALCAIARNVSRWSFGEHEPITTRSTNPFLMSLSI